ncbi:MAG: hypothetical protein ARM1_0691 [Candidatus Micrarchaeota archaeon]|nr:MAG: hypothetical protein ARM1_0691 [Candidatus Micrarchaeota archaeon]
MDTRKLEYFNHWWIKGKVDLELALTFKRDVYNEIKARLDSRFIIALTGLRRVGKSTIMYQLIDDLISNGVDATDILFFSFDESNVSVNEVIKAYTEFHKKDLREKRAYIFLDEIQKCKNWENEVKIYYDIYPKLKIIVSGSESLFIRKRSKETLSGRVFEFKIDPFSFSEYLKINGVNKKEFIYETKILPYFYKYIAYGGFPETFKFNSEKDFREYIRALVVDRIIYQDTPRIFHIDDPDFLRMLFELVASNPGLYIDYQSIGREFGKDRRVVRDYFRYLEESFLIRTLVNYRKSSASKLRKLKRAYPTDNAFIHLYRPDFDEEFKGKLVETAVVNALKADAFWKSSKEVDIVLEGKPIEVKYQESLREEDLKAIIKFMSRFDEKEGVVLTKNDEMSISIRDKTIKLIPVHKLLLYGRMII